MTAVFRGHHSCTHNCIHGSSLSSSSSASFFQYIPSLHMYKPSQPCLTLFPKSSILITPNKNIHFFSSDRFLSVLPSPNYTLQHVSLPSCKLLFHSYCCPVTNLPNHATTPPGRWHPQQTLQLSAGRAGNLNTSTPKHKYRICLIISWISVWRCAAWLTQAGRTSDPWHSEVCSISGLDVILLCTTKHTSLKRLWKLCFNIYHSTSVQLKCQWAEMFVNVFVLE